MCEVRLVKPFSSCSQGFGCDKSFGYMKGMALRWGDYLASTRSEAVNMRVGEVHKRPFQPPSLYPREARRLGGGGGAEGRYGMGRHRGPLESREWHCGKSTPYRKKAYYSIIP